MIEEENLNEAIIENNQNKIDWLYSQNQAHEYFDDPNLIGTFMSAYQEDSNEALYEQTYNEVQEETYNELVTNEVEQEKYQNLLTKHKRQFMI